MRCRLNQESLAGLCPPRCQFTRLIHAGASIASLASIRCTSCPKFPAPRSKHPPMFVPALFPTIRIFIESAQTLYGFSPTRAAGVLALKNENRHAESHHGDDSVKTVQVGPCECPEFQTR